MALFMRLSTYKSKYTWASIKPVSAVRPRLEVTQVTGRTRGRMIVPNH